MDFPLVARLVGWLETRLRVDVRYLVSGSFFLGLVQATSAILSFGITIAFANLLSPEAFGEYKYLLAVYAVLTLAALPGIDIAVLQAMSQGKDGTLAEGLRTKLRFGLLGGLASLLFAVHAYLSGSMGLAGAFLVIGVGLPLAEAFLIYTSAFNSKRRYKEWAFAEIVGQIVSSASLFAAALLGSGVLGLAIAYILPYVLVRSITYWYARRLRQNAETEPKFKHYGRSLTLLQVMGRIAGSVDQIVLFHFLGPAQVAIYSLATAIPNRLQSLLKVTGTLSFPRFSTRTPLEILVPLPRKMFIFGLGILAVCAAYALAAPFIFSLLFPDYLSSIPYSQVSVLFILSAITYPMGSYLLAHKRLAENYAIMWGSAGLKIACLLALTPFYGIWGAIIGMLASSFAVIVISLVILARETTKAQRETSSNTTSISV